MYLLHGIHSRLDAQHDDLDYLKVSKEGTTSSFGAATASSQQLGSNRQASNMGAATGIDDLAEDVQARLAKRAQQLPLLIPYNTESSSDDGEDLPLTTRCR